RPPPSPATTPSRSRVRGRGGSAHAGPRLPKAPCPALPPARHWSGPLRSLTVAAGDRCTAAVASGHTAPARRGAGASGRRGVGASRRGGDGRRTAAVGPRGRRRGDGRRSDARRACGAAAAGRRSARRTLAVGAAGFRAELLTGLALQLPAVGPQLPELGVLDAQRPRIELRVQALLLLLT